MNFFLDENFPKSAIQWLNDRGHTAIDLRGTPDEGIPDSELFCRAQVANAVLLTTDRDFFHTIPELFKHHRGAIVIALRQPNRTRILERLEWFHEHISVTTLPNRVFQLRDKTWIADPSLES